MYAILPPRLSIPVTTLIFCGFWGMYSGWNFWNFWNVARVSGDEVADMLISLATFAVPFVYAKHVETTSRERARLIAELQAAQEALEAAHRRETEVAALHERERLARDLRDSLGHALAALAVQLEAIQRLYAVDPVRASAQVDELKP